MKPEDMIGAPCRCPECFQAGVSEKELRRDPRSGEWLHGQNLRRWYAARDEFFALKATIGPKSI